MIASGRTIGSLMLESHPGLKNHRGKCGMPPDRILPKSIIGRRTILPARMTIGRMTARRTVKRKRPLMIRIDVELRPLRTGLIVTGRNRGLFFTGRVPPRDPRAIAIQVIPKGL
jgi:hypothetical protein